MKPFKRAKYAVAPFVALALAVGVAAQGFGDARIAENRVLVKTVGSLGKRAAASDFGAAVSEARLLNPSKEGGGALFRRGAGIRQDNVYALTLKETGRDAVERALAALNANSAVEIAEPVYYCELLRTPNDPMYGDQYALERINAPRAWEITTGSRDVAVGIIDMGIVGVHPDLIDNLWVNPNPNEYGYINDVHGYDFMNRVGGIPTDTHSHGVLMAGVIGAGGNNGEGITGINWDVSLVWMGVSIGDRFIAMDAAIEALNYANNHNIAITNNSYGGSGYSRITEEAICNYNGLFVAAVGNDSRDIDETPFYPASYDCPNIIAVASTDAADELSSFSNSGANSVHIAAPGSGILSTWPIGRPSQYGGQNGVYAVMSGTSMAAPMVAGAAALVKSIRPDYTPGQLRDVLIASARRVDALDGFGILDAHAALLNGAHELIDITYDYNDGEREPVVRKSVPGIRPVTPGRPLRDGYVFAGWHTEAEGGEPFDGEATEDMTLYARWMEIENGARAYALEFSDAVFRREVLRLINALDGGERTEVSVITVEDRSLFARIKFLDVSSRGVRDMTGLEYFAGLADLDCSFNELTALDVSGNTALTFLDCRNNRLAELNVSGLKSLEELVCGNNKLPSLDASGLDAARVIDCGNNELRELDVSGLSLLSELRCPDNRLTGLDVTGLPLTSLLCGNNYMADESAVIGFDGEWDGVKFIFGPQKPPYSPEDAAAINALIERNELRAALGDIESWRFVEWNGGTPRRIVGIYLNAALTGDVSLAGLDALETLYLSNGRLSSLDLSGLSSLKRLNIVNNRLPGIDISDLAALEYLNCYGNRLLELDVGNNAELTILRCANNLLTALDVGNNAKLVSIDCSYNDMDGESAVTGFTGVWDGVDFIFGPQGPSPISVAENERAVSGACVDVETAVAAPVGKALTGAFTAGPNPAYKNTGAVNFYAAGTFARLPLSGTLVIYDATGGVVGKVSVNGDAAADSRGGRVVAAWDLTDARGRPVSAGTYLVRGTVAAPGGRRKNVSLLVGVR